MIELGTGFFGGRLEHSFNNITAEGAAKLFQRLGLTGDFWKVE